MLMVVKGRNVLVMEQFKLEVNENDNYIELCDDAVLKVGKIIITGSNNRVYIGPKVKLNVSIIVKADNCSVYIGEKTTMLNVLISMHESGSIYIGKDCMLSGGIRMDVSDMHSIIDKNTGERLNPAKDIHINDHVWLANGVTVLKGTVIGRNSVVGSSSVTSGCYPNNSLVVGVPGKVIKENINWDREIL